MRLIRLNTVVFPAPFGPINVNTSPRRTSKLTLLTASTPPKRTLRSRADNRTSALIEEGELRARNTAEPALPGRWCCPLQGLKASGSQTAGAGLGAAKR